MDLRIEPALWEIRYPAQVDPIGSIRRERDTYRAWLHEEDLGPYPTGDAAVEAIWERFLEENRVRHAAASVTHGGHNRHLPRGEQ